MRLRPLLLVILAAAAISIACSTTPDGSATVEPTTPVQLATATSSNQPTSTVSKPTLEPSNETPTLAPAASPTAVPTPTPSSSPVPTPTPIPAAPPPRPTPTPTPTPEPIARFSPVVDVPRLSCPVTNHAAGTNLSVSPAPSPTGKETQIFINGVADERESNSLVLQAPLRDARQG